eukprot:SAG11_NODE_98_length_16927_cov_35.166211_4_plen_291_part_00
MERLLLAELLQTNSETCHLSIWCATAAEVMQSATSQPQSQAEKEKAKDRKRNKKTENNGGKVRAKRRMWSAEEEAALQEGVKEHGEGRWKKIQSDPTYPFLRTNRSSVDLKDKWRVISRKRRKLEEQANGMAADPGGSTSTAVRIKKSMAASSAAAASLSASASASASAASEKKAKRASPQLTKAPVQKRTSSGSTRGLGALIDAKEAEKLAHDHTTEDEPPFWLQWDDPSAQDHNTWYKVHVRPDNPPGMPAGWCLLHIYADFHVEEAFNLVKYAASSRLRRYGSTPGD